MTLDKVLEIQTLNDFGDKELRLIPNQRLEAFTGEDISQVQNVAHIYHESNVPFQPEDDTAYFGTIKAPEIGGGHNVSIISDGSTEAKYMGLHSTGYTLISGVRAKDIGKGSKGVLVVKDASQRMEDSSFPVGTNAETVEAENIFGPKVHYSRGQMTIGWCANKVAAKGVRAGALYIGSEAKSVDVQEVEALIVADIGYRSDKVRARGIMADLVRITPSTTDYEATAVVARQFDLGSNRANIGSENFISLDISGQLYK